MVLNNSWSHLKILMKKLFDMTTYNDFCFSGQGANKPGLMVLTTGLSKPFRHLERYAGLMQEVEQHLSDDHPDRGDTQRSIGFYKNIAVDEYI